MRSIPLLPDSPTRKSGRRARGAILDDEEASPRWLTSLVSVAGRTNVDALFGPIEGRAEAGAEIGAFSPYFSRRLDRPDGANVTELSAHLGANTSLFDRARRLAGPDPFDVALNAFGGGDSLPLWRLRREGARFAWATRAQVVEWAPRWLTWAYVTRRKFLSGQIRVFVPIWLAPSLGRDRGLDRRRPRPFVRADAALATFSRLRSRRAQAAVFGGLGKALWQKSFRSVLHGGGLAS